MTSSSSERRPLMKAESQGNGICCYQGKFLIPIMHCSRLLLMESHFNRTLSRILIRSICSFLSLLGELLPRFFFYSLLVKKLGNYSFIFNYNFFFFFFFSIIIFFLFLIKFFTKHLIELLTFKNYL